MPQAEEGIARMKKLAEMIEREHPEAAASLREGLEETFTINRAAEFTPLPGNHQRDRKSASRSSKESRQRLPLP